MLLKFILKVPVWISVRTGVSWFSLIPPTKYDTAHYIQSRPPPHHLNPTDFLQSFQTDCVLNQTAGSQHNDCVYWTGKYWDKVLKALLKEFCFVFETARIPVAASFNRWSAVPCCPNRGFKPCWQHGCSSVVFVVCCVSNDIGCYELVTLSEESYRVCVCVCVCVWCGVCVCGVCVCVCEIFCKKCDTKILPQVNTVSSVV